MNLLERIISFIAPHECLGCGHEGTLLCSRCYRSLPSAPIKPVVGMYRIWPGVVYAGIAKGVLHELKFSRAAAAAADIAAHMAATLPRDVPWIVTHVPTAPSRVRQRGYDQSRLIAKSLAQQIGASYMPLLARSTNVRQVGSTRAQRQKQMRTAFRVLRNRRIYKAHILLVDDVLTTGATIRSAATVLHSAGAGRVSAAFFATADRAELLKNT